MEDVLNFTIKSSTFDHSTEFSGLNLLNTLTNLSELVVAKS